MLVHCTHWLHYMVEILNLLACQSKSKLQYWNPFHKSLYKEKEAYQGLYS